MTDHDAHAPDTDAVHHADAGDAGHDDHHDGGSLGPVDWRMWGAGALGVVAGLVVVAAFTIATDFTFLVVPA